jgi:hypothetical protein
MSRRVGNRRRSNAYIFPTQMLGCGGLFFRLVIFAQDALRQLNIRSEFGGMTKERQHIAALLMNNRQGGTDEPSAWIAGHCRGG